MHAAIERNEFQRTEEIMSDHRHYEQSYVPFAAIDGQTKALILLRDVTEEKMYRAKTMRAGEFAFIGKLLHYAPCCEVGDCDGKKRNQHPVYPRRSRESR